MNSIPEVAINTIAKGSSICGKHKRNPPNKIPKMEQIQPIIIFFIILSPSSHYPEECIAYSELRPD
jgi:hypothetical protein